MHLGLRFSGFLLAALAAGRAGGAFAQTVLVQDSPFLPSGAVSDGPGSNASAAFELAGASVTDRGAEVCIYDVKKKHSRWIGVGTVDGDIQVMSYDAARDRVVLRVSGEQQVLELRKEPVSPASHATFPVAGSNLPAQYRGPPPNLGTPLQIDRQVREARMLVSDLMQVSAQQRQAYEDAKKKRMNAAGK